MAKKNKHSKGQLSFFCLFVLSCFNCKKEVRTNSYEVEAPSERAASSFKAMLRQKRNRKELCMKVIYGAKKRYCAPAIYMWVNNQFDSRLSLDVKEFSPVPSSIRFIFQY